jgi:hypothetical protein
MPCKFAPLVARYQDQSLDAEQSRRVELHVALCRECPIQLTTGGAELRVVRPVGTDTMFASYRNRLATQWAVAGGEMRPARASAARFRWLVALAGLLAGAAWSYAFLLR